MTEQQLSHAQGLRRSPAHGNWCAEQNQPSMAIGSRRSAN